MGVLVVYQLCCPPAACCTYSAQLCANEPGCSAIRFGLVHMPGRRGGTAGMRGEGWGPQDAHARLTVCVSWAAMRILPALALLLQ